MKALFRGLAAAMVCGLGLLAILVPGQPSYGFPGSDGTLAATQSDLTSTTIGAIVAANGGKPPASGEQLWKTLGKLGKFAQLPVVFSAVRLDSGIGNPRVVITPVIDGLSDADVTRPNLNGRLFLAANMERGINGGDPRVRSVEFISWNTQRRRFDFGAIENMGGDGEPELRIVDGGRCFSCHKNRGPIMGVAPWTDTTHHKGLRALVADRFKLVDVIPPGEVAAKMRDRIDGMALAAPQAVVVDGAIRLGTVLVLNRETFQLMNKSTGGRKGFVAMLIALTGPGPIDPNTRLAKQVLDAWGSDQSYTRFTSDWVALTKATNSGMLIDFAPMPKPLYESWGGRQPGIRPIPPPPPGGFPSQAAAQTYERRVRNLRDSNELNAKLIASRQEQLTRYDSQRAAGKPNFPNSAQPSNPRAFVHPVPKATSKPSGMVNPVMLASTIGLSEGDRDYLTRRLNEAVKRVSKPKVTATTLARAVFEGPVFADVLAGGPLPDRDEFKDRFVAGLQQLLKTKYPFTQGIPIKRSEYASGPVYDPKLGEAKEIAVTPTTACLRCHDIRPSGKRTVFEAIPPLVFDPFDKTGREAWLKSAPPKRKVEVLGRLVERLHEDKDMPPEDSPEFKLFRTKEAAAFDDLKSILSAELATAKGK